MMGKQTKFGTMLIFAAVVLQPGLAKALDYQLIAKPAKCVSLNQGNICYQTISFHWQAPKESAMCLFQQEQEQPLKCWEQGGQGVYKHDFTSDRSLGYRLILQSNGSVLAETAVEVKWVYKGRKNNRYGWRVF
jgi:hypothetical protein